MNITLDVPATAEETLRQAWGGELHRAAFDALILEGYRTAKLSIGEVAELLGFETRFEAETWLGKRGVTWNYGLDDLEADRRTLAGLCGKPL